MPECVVCNLVVLPKSLAYDFLLYCVRNPKPCPVVEVLDPGKAEPVKEIPSGVMPVFWACGVTPQSAAIEAKCPLMIAHAPTHGFISDLKADRICIP